MKKDKHLRTGGDPRALADYIALREELMKLSHPARPDVDWKYAESLCLKLFENNGVELQTAAWYLLARTHIAGLAGINEGLALINALSTYQWSVMWPGSTHSRMEIIAAMNQRLQNAFRTLPLADRDDLTLLYQTKKNLAALIELLTRHELKQASRLDVLQQQVGQAITRLENAPHAELAESEVILPPQAIASEPAETLSESGPRIYVVHPDPSEAVAQSPGSLRRQAEVRATVFNSAGSADSGFPPAGSLPAVHLSGRSARRAFVAGMGCALLVGGVLLWGWHSVNRPSAARQQLAASLTPLPERLSEPQLSDLRQSDPDADIFTDKMQEQLKWLMSLSPGWPEQYGRELIAQAVALWPGNPNVMQMQQAWQQQMENNALPLAAMNNWHEGMDKLQQLAERLNGLDEKRGKYMTVSQLKSEVFTITQAFNRTPPAEELLRQYEAASPDLQRRQAEMALDRLQKRFVLLSGKSLPERQNQPAATDN
ncbi:VasL domain-containing protein [Erwinia sp. JUb26]|uniref:VasL domain-containing protein n=1 Tax=Erwinia sp. JUb26 TaxID=2485126 RepID=UPI000FA020A9|nr:VasL domain-containing protein [Erwinia sp. JUb26]ROR05757.1 type VI secretion system protein VasL [Erwinia sp. JUb26]